MVRVCANRQRREIRWPGAPDGGPAPRTAARAFGECVSEDRRSRAARWGAWVPKIRRGPITQALRSDRVRIYNTLSRSKEELRPLEPPHVRIYSCGPTVYKYAHIGNFRTYVFADVLCRVLEYLGCEVTQVMNITDVGHLTDDQFDRGEDKMLVTARLENRSAEE